MTRLLCAVAAIALVAPTAATAQRQHNRDHNNSAAPQQQQQQQQPQRQQQQKRERHSNNPTSTHRQQSRDQNGRVTLERRSTRGMSSRMTGRSTSNHSTGTAARNVYRIGHRPATYHRIRTSTFRYPHGYGYRRWSIGSILPHLFLTSPYYWSDYGALGLLAPPPGYVWVRYGPDLLLVNKYTGRIADVIFGAFY